MICRRDGLLCSNSSGLRTIPEQQRRQRQQNQQQQYPQQSRQEPHGVSGSGTRSSEDTLLNHGVEFQRVDSGETLVDRHNKRGNSSMSGAADDENVAVQTERRRSYGIGGAGNMRLPSAVKAAMDAPEPESNGGSQRRRSSVWSTQSSGSTVGAIVSKILRRGSKTEETNADTTASS